MPLHLEVREAPALVVEAGEPVRRECERDSGPRVGNDELHPIHGIPVGIEERILLERAVLGVAAQRRIALRTERIGERKALEQIVVGARAPRMRPEGPVAVPAVEDEQVEPDDELRMGPEVVQGQVHGLVVERAHEGAIAEGRRARHDGTPLRADIALEIIEVHAARTTFERPQPGGIPARDDLVGRGGQVLIVDQAHIEDASLLGNGIGDLHASGLACGDLLRREVVEPHGLARRRFIGAIRPLLDERLSRCGHAPDRGETVLVAVHFLECKRRVAAPVAVAGQHEFIAAIAIHVPEQAEHLPFAVQRYDEVHAIDVADEEPLAAGPADHSAAAGRGVNAPASREREHAGGDPAGLSVHVDRAVSMDLHNIAANARADGVGDRDARIRGRALADLDLEAGVVGLLRHDEIAGRLKIVGEAVEGRVMGIAPTSSGPARRRTAGVDTAAVRDLDGDDIAASALVGHAAERTVRLARDEEVTIRIHGNPVAGLLRRRADVFRADEVPPGVVLPEQHVLVVQAVEAEGRAGRDVVGGRPSDQHRPVREGDTVGEHVPAVHGGLACPKLVEVRVELPQEGIPPFVRIGEPREEAADGITHDVMECRAALLGRHDTPPAIGESGPEGFVCLQDAVVAVSHDERLVGQRPRRAIQAAVRVSGHDDRAVRRHRDAARDGGTLVGEELLRPSLYAVRRKAADEH